MKKLSVSELNQHGESVPSLFELTEEWGLVKNDALLVIAARLTRSVLADLEEKQLNIAGYAHFSLEEDEKDEVDGENEYYDN